jgi:DUF4097 and DUF4098 domain-containing protein YvlB
MKLPSILLFLGSAAAVASTEEQLNKRFSVQPGGTLTVDVRFGSIKVSTSTDNEVVVDAWRKIGRKSKADEVAYLRDNPIEVSQDGANVTIRCRGNPSWRSSWSLFSRGYKNEARYTITVPAKFNSRLKTSGGEIRVQDLTGDTQANTSGGGLRFAHLHGGLDATTSGGSIHLTDGEGTLKVHTSGGGIDVATGSGSLEATTSGGGIRVKDFNGPTRVNTSGGGLSLEHLVGEVHGSTSGGSIHAVLSAPLGEATKLTTSGGGITVRLPENEAFNLDASTSGGSVRSEFPVASIGKAGHSHLKGTVNGGGKSVVLHTSGGSIQVNRL